MAEFKFPFTAADIKQRLEKVADLVAMFTDKGVIKSEHLPPTDWNAAEGERGHVLNRTHYETPPAFDIQWDGDMTGKFALDVSPYGFAQGVYFVKVSDHVSSIEEYIGASVEEGSGFILEVTASDINSYAFPGSFVVAQRAVVVHDSATLSGALGVPTGYITNGTYFWIYTEENTYTARLSGPATIKKIDKKFLPEDINIAADWSASKGESGYIKNRTHYSIKRFADMVYDFNNDGRDSVNLSLLELPTGYKISDYVMSREDVANSQCVTYYNNGSSPLRYRSPLMKVSAVIYAWYMPYTFLTPLLLCMRL